MLWIRFSLDNKSNLNNVNFRIQQVYCWIKTFNGPKIDKVRRDRIMDRSRRNRGSRVVRDIPKKDTDIHIQIDIFDTFKYVLISNYDGLYFDARVKEISNSNVYKFILKNLRT